MEVTGQLHTSAALPPVPIAIRIQSASETPDGFRNLKTSLPATQRFHTDIHRAQCCLNSPWTWECICVNKFFHFALKRYLISKTVRYFWSTCIISTNVRDQSCRPRQGGVL
jgi:hypothetical protein